MFKLKPFFRKAKLSYSGISEKCSHVLSLHVTKYQMEDLLNARIKPADKKGRLSYLLKYQLI